MPVDVSPIFVIGCTRSGKSLVAAILNKHPDLYITFESQIYSSLYRKWTYRLREGVSDPHAVFKELILNRDSDLKIGKEELDRCLEESGPSWESMYNEYMRLVISKNRPGATRWGDKTPVDAGTTGIIHRHYPNVQFVYLYRDPRDTVSSMSLPSYSPCVNNHLINADVYDQYLREYSKEIYRDDLNILHVRYESLVANPAGEVGRICNFLNLDFRPQLLKPASESIRKPIGWEGFSFWDDIKVQPVEESCYDPYVEAYLTRWIDEMEYQENPVNFRQLKRIATTLYLLPFKITRRLLKFFFQRKYPKFPYICYSFPRAGSLKRWLTPGKTNGSKK